MKKSVYSNLFVCLILLWSFQGMSMEPKGQKAFEPSKFFDSVIKLRDKYGVGLHDLPPSEYNVQIIHLDRQRSVDRNVPVLLLEKSITWKNAAQKMASKRFDSIKDQSVNAFDALVELLDELETNVKNTYSGASIYTDRQVQEDIESNLKTIDLKALYDIIHLVNYLDIRLFDEPDREECVLLHIACKAFAANIEFISDLEHVLNTLRDFGEGIAPIVVHYILKEHEIIEHLIQFSKNKQQITSLYTSQQDVTFISTIATDKVGHWAFILQTDQGCQLYVYDPQKGLLNKFNLMDTYVVPAIGKGVACAFAPDGNYLVYIAKPTEATSVYLYTIDLQNNTLTKMDLDNLQEPPFAVAFFDKDTIIVGGDSNIYLYDVHTGKSEIISDIFTKGAQQPAIKIIDIIPSIRKHYFKLYLINTVENKEMVMHILYDQENKWDIKDDLSPQSEKSFELDEVLKLLKLDTKAIKKEFIGEKVADAYVCENLYTYQLLIEKKVPTQGKPLSSVSLIDFISKDLVDCINQFNERPLAYKKIPVIDALYLLAAQLYDWDLTKPNELFIKTFAGFADRSNQGTKEEVTIENIVSDSVLALAGIKNSPPPELKHATIFRPQLQETMPAGVPSSDNSLSSSSLESAQGGDDAAERGLPAQPPVAPGRFTWLSQSFMNAQQKAAQFYATYQRRIKQGLGIAAAGAATWFGTWLYQKYMQQSGVSFGVSK